MRANLRIEPLWSRRTLFTTLIYLIPFISFSWYWSYSLRMLNRWSKIRYGMIIQQYLYFLEKIMVLTASCIGRKHSLISWMWRGSSMILSLLMRPIFPLLDFSILFCKKKIMNCFSFIRFTQHIILLHSSWNILPHI